MKIDLMIIGAQKAGTTSLIKLMDVHPSICAHHQNEFPFFVNDEYFSEGINTYWNEYFQHYQNEDIIAAKSVGVMYSKDILERVKNHNPSMKIVLILRDPVKRAYSAYWYARRKGWEPEVNFERALKLGGERFGNNWLAKTNCDYLTRGEYSKHLNNIFSVFDKDNVLVYKFEDFKGKEAKICNDIWEKIGLDTHISVDNIRKIHNEASMPKFNFINKIFNSIRIPKKLTNNQLIKILRKGKNKILKINEIPFDKPRMNEDTRKMLSQYYTNSNNEVAKKLRWDISNWT